MNKIVFNSPANKLTDAEKLVLYERSWSASENLLTWLMAEAREKIPEFSVPSELWAPYEFEFTNLVMSLCEENETIPIEALNNTLTEVTV